MRAERSEVKFRIIIISEGWVSSGRQGMSFSEC